MSLGDRYSDAISLPTKRIRKRKSRSRRDPSTVAETLAKWKAYNESYNDATTCPPRREPRTGFPVDHVATSAIDAKFCDQGNDQAALLGIEFPSMDHFPNFQMDEMFELRTSDIAIPVSLEKKVKHESVDGDGEYPDRSSDPFDIQDVLQDFQIDEMFDVEELLSIINSDSMHDQSLLQGNVYDSNNMVPPQPSSSSNQFRYPDEKLLGSLQHMEQAPADVNHGFDFLNEGREEDLNAATDDFARYLNYEMGGLGF
ncbi:hypothetical protein SDJN02_07342, partial [Cucurbita argyrosperma subsp. argyrosperma]